MGPQKQSQHKREAEVLWVQMDGKLWLCCLQNENKKGEHGFGSRMLVLHCTTSRGDKVDALGGCVQAAKQNSRISYGIQNHPKHSGGQGETTDETTKKTKSCCRPV